MMKRLIPLILAIAMMLSAATVLSSCGKKDLENPLEKGGGTEGLEYYPLPDNTYGVKAGTTFYLPEIEIPKTHNGKPVTQILPQAFHSATNLTDITIPDSVTSIGEWAFKSCSSLTSVVIPDSVTSIGNYAFYECFKLTSVVIGDSVTSIGHEAFYYCSSLTSVVIGDSVTSIGDSAFYECFKLTSVVISDSVTSIGERAFSGCSSLTDVYYTGSEAEWQMIKIRSSNSCLTSATIHFDYVPEN